MPSLDAVPEQLPADTLRGLESRRSPRVPSRRLREAQVLLRDGEAPFPAVTHDLSLGGVGLLCDRPLEPGAVVLVRLSEPGGTAPASGLLARVAHATPRGPGEWHVGCAFQRRLRPDELRALL